MSSLFYFTACIHCVDEDPRFNFISLTPAEADTVILKRYSKGNGFITVLDSSTFSEGNDYRMKQSGDTISFPSRLENFSLNPNFDWIVFLPRVNRSFRISDIDKESGSGDCSGKVQCVNGVHSLKIAGMLQSLENTFFNFYISK